MGLTDRPRVRRLIERAAERALSSVARPDAASHGPAPESGITPGPARLFGTAVAESAHDAPPADGPGPESPGCDGPVTVAQTPAAEDFARELLPEALALERATVSSLLFERLSLEDVAEVQARLAEVPELDSHYSSTDSAALRNALVLAYGLWLGVAAVSEKTGLTRDQPPADVHAMARGPLAAAGGLYEADLVIQGLTSAGADIGQVDAALDFGCSSGRVVRSLAAGYPEIKWHGCDPNRPAIEWASANLPAIDFFINDDSPPLPLASASLALVYAISIWSHFKPPLGLRWFEEMRRIIRPGGHLVCTTHGFTSVAYYALLELRTPEQSREIADSLYRKGWWYAAEFGEEGDWGVVNPDWGTAFISPEWLLAQLCPRWRVLEFAPGRNQDNQDVYVLQRA
jgi:SAM-dependent methyltransferase